MVRHQATRHSAQDWLNDADDDDDDDDDDDNDREISIE